MNNVYPRNFSHIGISVPNLEEAVQFYTKVMGWYLIMKPTDVVEDDSPSGKCVLTFSAPAGAVSASRISQPGIESVLSCSNSGSR